MNFGVYLEYLSIHKYTCRCPCMVGACILKSNTRNQLIEIDTVADVPQTFPFLKCYPLLQYSIMIFINLKIFSAQCLLFIILHAFGCVKDDNSAMQRGIQHTFYDYEVQLVETKDTKTTAIENIIQSNCNPYPYLCTNKYRVYM